MQYALVEGVPQEATSGANGICGQCGAPAVAKCGPKVMHHWAHAGRKNCDPWWENETEWHRAWKNLFPSQCREVSHTAPTGEVHRADIKSPGGLYIEVQHSAMTDAERSSREEFYKNLVWIVDARKFASSFSLHHILPDPSLKWAQDLAWVRVSRPPSSHSANGMYFKFSLIAKDKAEWPEGNMHEVFSLHHIMGQVEASYIGHHQYHWRRPYTTWLSATCPVYLDFGTERMMRLETYPVCNIPCVRLISKSRLIADLLSKTSAGDVCL